MLQPHRVRIEQGDLKWRQLILIYAMQRPDQATVVGQCTKLSDFYNFALQELYWLANIVKTFLVLLKSTFDLFKWPVLRPSITYLSFLSTGVPYFSVMPLLL